MTTETGRSRLTRPDGPRPDLSKPGDEPGSPTPQVRTAKAGYSDLVLVCRTCAKRQGFKKNAVRRLLTRELKRRGLGRTTRVVEGGCLGPCPKRLMAVATPDSLAQSRILLIDPASLPEQAVDAIFAGVRPAG